ncbi:MAG: rhodanese-like domain-containing protein [Polyangiaceae bacterium]|nr:rhodanese-like domain-containing protein [Polyangiaceae bacterium]
MGLKFVLGLVGVLAVGLFFFFGRSGGGSSRPDARRLVDEGALLLDVRTREEFAAGHLPGAINVPVQELSARIGEVGPKDRPIVVYCRSGARSGSAARMLGGAGFSVIHDLGPMSRW